MLIESRRSGFGNITEPELKNIQHGLLKLILEFDTLCKKHNIEYYLDGGSVIGALRHSGFIPWDDDIDILMKRDQFERLLSVIDDELKGKPNRFLSYMARRESHHRSFARYVNTDVLHAIRNTIVEANYPPGIFIDIFILDPVPAGCLDKHLHVLETTEEWFHKRINGTVGRVSYFKYRLTNLWEKIVGEDKIFQCFDKRLSRYHNDEAAYYVPRNGFNYAVYDADVFQKPKYAQFEGHSLPIPTLPEKYLRAHYSIDWFNLPPIHARYSTHYTLSSETIDAIAFARNTGYLEKQQDIFKTQEKRHNYQLLAKKPYREVKTVIAQLRACADEIQFERYLVSKENEIDGLISASLYNEIVAFFEPYLQMQLYSDYRSFGIAVALRPKYLEALLFSLVKVGRFYDAERILRVHNGGCSEFNNIKQLIELERNIEIQEQDDPEKSKPILYNVPAFPDVSLPEERSDPVFEKEVNLLNEIHDLCIDNNIKYTLTDNVLLDAVRKGRWSGTYNGITIAMTPENYRRFHDLAGGLPSSRGIESVKSNRFYPSSSMRYVDKDTTCFHVTAPSYQMPGIHVQIRLITGPESRKQRVAARRMNRIAKYSYFLPLFIRWFSSPLTARNVRYTTQLQNAVVEKLTFPITSRLGAVRIRMNADELNTYQDITFNGNKYYVLSKLYTSVREVHWLDKVQLTSKYNKAYRVNNVDVPYSDYMDRVASINFHKFYFSALKAVYLQKKIKKIERSPYSHKKILFDVGYKFTEYKMLVEYKPKLNKLLKLLASKKYNELELSISSYIENFDYYFQHKKILVGHHVLIVIYIQILRHKGEVNLANYIARRLAASAVIKRK